jgi:manganese oxidase
MPAPDNTLPMMTGTGPFGPIEMGGMFTVVKVREGLARGDYLDPPAYKHPEGTVAHEVDAPALEPARSERPARAEPMRRTKM